MGYAQLSNDLWRNLKMRQVSEEHPREFSIWILSISYCSDKLTDGMVSEYEIRAFLGVKPREEKRMCELGLWEKTAEGIRIHDYLTMQRSREDVRKDRESGARRQRKHRQNNALRNGDGHTDVTDTKPQTLQTTNTQTLLSKDKSERDPLPTNEQIRKWAPKPEHRQQVMEMVDKGYPLIDLDNLAKEFRSSLLSKGIDHYQYRDLDAAFDTWILKRAQSKRDQHQSETINQDTALADRQWHEPRKEPEHKTVYGGGSPRVLSLLGLDAPVWDWKSRRLADLLNEGKTDEAALAELQRMEQQRSQKETIS
jgi:hypothetical protein